MLALSNVYPGLDAETEKDISWKRLVKSNWDFSYYRDIVCQQMVTFPPHSVAWSHRAQHQSTKAKLKKRTHVPH